MKLLVILFLYKLYSHIIIFINESLLNRQQKCEFLKLETPKLTIQYPKQIAKKTATKRQFRKPVKKLDKSLGDDDKLIRIMTSIINQT